MKARDRMLGITVLVLAAAALGYALPLAQWLQSFVIWVRAQGPFSGLIYAGVYVLVTPLMVPGTLLTVGAGFLFGPVYGTLLASPASVLGASLSFALARSLARDWITARIARYPRFASIDRAMERHGFKMVLLLRLQPISIPFGVMNYAIGLTRVRLRDYVLASWIGMLPSTALYVYLGSAIQDVAQLGGRKTSSAGGWEKVLFWAGLAATVVFVWVLGRIAKDALKHSLNDPPSSA